MAKQIPLDLEAPEPFAQVRFIRTPALEAITNEVLAPQNWPAPHLCLTGPQGSGKTHILHMFAEGQTGVYLSAEQTLALDTATLASQPIAVDDADQASEEVLFHLYNRAMTTGQPLLLASRQQPLVWATTLPDLDSRVRSLRVLRLPETEDDLLNAILRKLFDQRAIRPSDDALEFLIRRMDRSVNAAQKIVTELEQYANGRAFNRALVRDFFNESDPLPFEGSDPFDSP